MAENPGYPAGFTPISTGSGAVHTIGTNLPPVDPNNFAGTVHFGPATTTHFPAGSIILPGGAVLPPGGPLQ
ncbi:unnamed protein product [Adineta ricciae]|uniref:Uncharacterized protein n=1 Tax=Adineta ricciae TaxID=249248 RepID=A0A815A4R7_ADIRI|nr:unnamed protein product [Adineta ricciae]